MKTLLHAIIPMTIMMSILVAVVLLNAAHYIY